MTRRGEPRFVCVFNRDRDSYQVPVALEEAGLLDAFVTDFYAPSPTASWLPGNLRRKQHPALPPQRVKADRLAFFVQYGAQLLGLPMTKVWKWVDSRLGRVAGRLAKSRRAHLYCYHYYLPPNVADDVCLIVFVFHPLPQSYLGALEKDCDEYSEARESFAVEAAASQAFELPLPWSRPDAIVCASSVTARSVIAAGGPAERVFVIPYGLPGEQTPDLKQGDWDQPRFLFVGQGVQRKGLHHLIRAWQSRPRGAARLTIVGYHIDAAIRDLVTDPAITLLDYQPREELARLFAGSDVLAMPSLLEGFGLVYLEALSHGCHVLATPNTGVPDLRLDGVAATIVPAGDIRAIDAAISELIERKRSNGFDRSAIAAQGRRWTQADFRKAIADNARAVLACREGSARAYPREFAYRP